MGVIPSVVVIDDWFSPKPKPEALAELAAKVLDPRLRALPTAYQWLCCAGTSPRSESGKGPPGGLFTDEVDAITEWARISTTATWPYRDPRAPARPSGAPTSSIALICADQRVGITAMSHHAIDNLLAGDHEGIRQGRRSGQAALHSEG